MKTHTRVAVIGGGVVGASVLYHLARSGWTDVVLMERDELTSGSTWHAAGGMHTLNCDPNVAKLQKYTIELYREIEQASGQSCGIHITAGVDLAGTPERMDFLKVACARGRYLGLNMEMLTIEEAARLFPLLDKQHFVGALYNPLEGHVDPAGVTQAYAKAARNLGADVYRFTRVTDLKPRADGSWDVITDKGDLVAEHVVNAAGLWAREVGRFVGVTLPVLAMEHQYLITGEIAEVVASPKEVLHAIDFEGEIYMRQEGKGMLIGTYEKAGVPWAERETPWNFAHELLPPDLDRIAGSLEVGFRHFPALERAGIKKIINGPFTFAPDGNPLIGPIRGLHNFWVACGVMAGFSQGGGVGLALSNWMVSGDPGFDVWAMDVARFGDWATMAYTNAKVRENYSRRFSIRFPNEELPAARPLRMTPVYDRLKARGAVFGAAFGLEHPLWFGLAEHYHSRWFEAPAPPTGVGIRPLRTELVGLGIAGPKSRDLLARVCRDDVSNAALPFLSFLALEVAMLPARVGRISFTGELGYEIWVPADCQIALYDALVSAGADLGLVHFGARALNSLRLEKSFGNWAREYRPLYTPGEAGLDRFVDVEKPDFAGREAVLRDRASDPARRLVTFVVDANGADAIGDEPVWHDGEVVGWITSGGYGHCVGKSIALGYVPTALATVTSGFELEILGERRAASLAREPLFDPDGERMRKG